MKQEPNLSYDDLEEEDYMHMLGLQKRLYSFPLLTSLKRGIGIASLIACVCKYGPKVTQFLSNLVL